MNTSDRMRRIRGKDTAPEMVVRRLVHSMGYRYRLHRRDLPGCPDIVFISRRKVVFVNGCFWHAHGRCPKGNPPKANAGFWIEKLNSNRHRDQQNYRRLRNMGWRYLVLWECELRNPDRVKSRVQGFLEVDNVFIRPTNIKGQNKE